jgi:mannitol/fructose-specific phosphotransferase system IIA component (Ntr-type)
MRLKEFFSPDAISLHLSGTTKDEILKELVDLLRLDEKSEGILLKMLKRRENLGSTGIGRGIAIPHCRSLIVDKLEIAVGRCAKPVNFDSIDKKAINIAFLIVAPPQDPENQYLLTLARIVQIGKELSKKELIMQPNTPEEFIQLIGQIEKNLGKEK